MFYGGVYKKIDLYFQIIFLWESVWLFVESEVMLDFEFVVEGICVILMYQMFYDEEKCDNY